MLFFSMFKGAAAVFVRYTGRCSVDDRSAFRAGKFSAHIQGTCISYRTVSSSI